MLPNFNQVAHTFERFTVADTPGVWPKVFQAPDHRIVLPSVVTMRVTVDALSAGQQIQVIIGGGAMPPWFHMYDVILAAGATYNVSFHPGPANTSAVGPILDYDFSIPDHMYLYALDIFSVQLIVLGATDDVTALTVSARTWIL